MGKGASLLPVLNEIVLQSSFVGAIAISDMVKSTLGPKGMVCLLFLSIHRAPILTVIINCDI